MPAIDADLDAVAIARFVEDGFLHLRRAFPRAVADECRAILWRLTGWRRAGPISPWDRPSAGRRATAAT